MAVPELLRAVQRGVFGSHKLSDAGRGVCAQALARSGDPNAAGALVKLLGSRRAGVQSKRSAAMALGRLMRETTLRGEDAARARKALLRSFSKERDIALRGFAALALGGAREPHATETLKAAIDHGGNAELKPWCALALGLAARTLGTERGKSVRVFLTSELDKAPNPDLAASLAIAAGIAQAHEATKLLLERLRRKGHLAAARGAAAQGLGLLQTKSKEAAEELERLALEGCPQDVLQDVVLALGLIGRRSIAPKLAKMLPRETSSIIQSRIMLALGHMDHSATVEPLLAVLRDARATTLVREFAAVALGMMGDRREEDLLFDLDAWFNFHATTPAGRELIRLY
jgi:hypothetical protein